MQTTDTRELPKRRRYYQSMIDLQMIDKGQHYKKFNPCYIIFISPFDIFQKGRHIYTFENICKEDKDLILGDGVTKLEEAVNRAKKNKEWRHEYQIE